MGKFLRCCQNSSKRGINPHCNSNFQIPIASALFIIAASVERRRKENYRLLIKKEDFPALLFLALIGVTFFFTAQYTGIQMAGASIAAILVCLLSPVFITVFSRVMFKEHLAKRQISGIAIAAMGTSILVAGGTTNFSENPTFLSGTLILLSTPILWATCSILGKKIMDKYNLFPVATYVNALGGLCLIPFALIENSFHQIAKISLNGWLAILYLAITCSFLGYYIWLYVMKNVGATVTSSFLFAEPLITALFAIIPVGETLSSFTILGGFLIFIGVCLVTKNEPYQ